MNESKILRTACDKKWYAHAYSEYLADVAQTTSNLMTALTEIINSDTMSADIAKDMLARHGIDWRARFILGELGSVTALQIAQVAWDEVERPDGYVPQYFPVEEMLTAIRGSWTQCVISSKAFNSYASDAKDKVSRITSFLQDVSADFQIDDTVRDVVSYYQSMINAAPDVSEFIDQFLNATGVNNAEETDDPMAYINADIYKYTGNTPGIALDFSTVNKAVSSTVSVAATCVKGVFKLASKAASWLFNKGKKYVVDTVIDPKVCEYVDNGDENSGYIDGFAWFGEFVPNVEYSYFDTGNQIADLFSGFYDDYANKWIKIKLVFGEFLFRIVDATNKWQCYFKPVAIDTTYFSSNYFGSVLEPSYNSAKHSESMEQYNQWLERVVSCSQPVSKDASKEDIYRGLVFSTHMMSSVSLFAFIEVYHMVKGAPLANIPSAGSILSDLRDYYSFNPVEDKYNVTNSKILRAASGNPSAADNINSYLSWHKANGASLNAGVPKYSIRSMMTSIIAIWALCRVERKQYPINYTFVPYSNNHASFSAPSWRIKSDQEIADTRDRFIEAAIAAVVAVVAITFIGAAATKISRRAFFKRQQQLGQLENKMWNGGKLTPAEQKKYIRYNRKQNASKWLNTGAPDVKSSLSNDNQSTLEAIRNSESTLSTVNQSVLNSVNGLSTSNKSILDSIHDSKSSLSSENQSILKYIRG